MSSVPPAQSMASFAGRAECELGDDARRPAIAYEHRRAGPWGEAEQTPAVFLARVSFWAETCRPRGSGGLVASLAAQIAEEDVAAMACVVLQRRVRCFGALRHRPLMKTVSL